MNQNIKNGLGIVAALVVLMLGYAAISYVNSYGKSIQPSSFRSFSASGEGKATAIPDVAEFTFTVITQGGTDVAALQADNTDKTNKAIAFVKSSGVEDKDIKTQSYNIDPRYQSYSCRSVIVPLSPISSSAGVSSGGTSGSTVVCPPASIVGYTVTQTVDVKIRDFSKTGDIMAGIVKNGANEVSSLSFTIDDPTKVQADARTEAITKAKANAENIAKAGGFSIGKLLSIQEGSYPIYAKAYDLTQTSAMGGATVNAAPSIQPGSQEVDVNVTLQYEIQ